MKEVRRLAGAALTLLATACGAVGGADDEQLPPVGLDVGMLAPELQGRAEGGAAFRIEELRGTPTVVVFYRGGYCGLCRERLRELQDNLAAYGRAGAEVVAVTPDPPDAAARTATELALAYRVVSADSAALERWELLGEGSAPLPSTVLLDRSGVIRYRHVGRHAADRARDVEVFAVLAALEEEPE